MLKGTKMVLRRIFGNHPTGFKKSHKVDAVQVTDVLDPETLRANCNFEICFDTPSSRYRLAGDEGKKGIQVTTSSLDEKEVKEPFIADGFMGVTPQERTMIIDGDHITNTGPVKAGSIYLKRK